MEPVAPGFLVQRLSKTYIEAESLLSAPTEAAERAKRLLLAGSRLWLQQQARSQTKSEPDGRCQSQHVSADGTTDGAADLALRTARRERLTQLYAVLTSCADALATSTELCQLCYHGCANHNDTGSIDDVAMQCMQHAAARQRTSGTMTHLHSQMWDGDRVKRAFQNQYCRTSALVMTKNWNLSAHEWCAATAREFFLMDQSVRERWLARDPATRSLITVLAPEMKRRMEACRAVASSLASALGTAGQHAIAHEVAAQLLPKLDSRLRLIDIGSCKNFFGERYPELCETVALDLCPADASVFECDILDLDIVAQAPQDDKVDTHSTGDGGNCASRGAGRLKWLVQASFDVAVISQVLSFIPSAGARALVLEKTRQLLRGGEGGILLVVEPARVLRHAGAQLIAAIEARGFRHVPGLRYERRGEAAVGLAFATTPIDANTEAWARARETTPVNVPTHPGYMHANGHGSN